MIIIHAATDLNEELRIHVLPLPAMNLTLVTDGVCTPVSAFITSTGGKNYSYSWYFSDGTSIDSDSSFVGHTFYNTGITDTSYKVKLILKTSDGCTDSISKDLVVYPRPRADFLVSPTIQDYPSTDVTLTNFSSAGNWEYLWRFGDGDTSQTKQPGGHSYVNYGDYSISLKTFSEHCYDTIYKIIHILPPPPVAGFRPDTAGCSPLAIHFNNTSLYAQSFVWDFDDGTYSAEESPDHTFYTSRDYEVKLLASGIKGSDEATHYIRVFPSPRAEFNAYPDSSSRTDQVFKFLDTSEKAVSYEWDFGDGSSSSEKNPSHVYGKEGLFDVSLYVMSENNCPDTLTRERYIKVIAGEGNIAFPNVFRWNGSGPTGGYWSPGEIDNTVFHPFFENVEEFKLLIYNRWGELMYTSDDIYKGWDGYIMKNGERATQGVYVYKAWIKYVDGRTEVKVGDVTFLY